jgi:Regulator of cell morphogenesis and NO signaling
MIRNIYSFASEQTEFDMTANSDNKYHKITVSLHKPIKKGNVMKHSLFSEKMKLADLALTNYRLLYVFPCFGIGLGFGECTVKQVCENKGISTSLFLLVCNVYTFDDYRPKINALTQTSLSGLMKYLQNSHKEYLENRMPKIISQVLNLVDCCHVKHGEMLTGFCDKYKQEVISHFSYEEQVVFPYISALLNGEKAEQFKIKEYESNHSDLDAALSDLKNIMLKYLPGECTIERCRDVLIDLSLFEADLSKHTLLEDQILISLVERIENNLQ